MAFEDWAKNPDGKVGVFPLVAYETLVPHGTMCGLKLHFLESPSDLLAGKSSSIPLIITPDFARRLASALVDAADEAEQGPSGERSQ